MATTNSHVRSYKVGDMFDDKDLILNEKFKVLLRQNNDLPTNELVKHVRRVRDKAWDIVPYPCIGFYLFQDISILAHPMYSDVLRRLVDGQHLLDIGAGLGQDLRQLHFNGAHARNFDACDYKTDLSEIGYELFNDRATFTPTFFCDNFFAKDSQLAAQRDSYDIIHASDFMHLFG